MEILPPRFCICASRTKILSFDRSKMRWVDFFDGFFVDFFFCNAFGHAFTLPPSHSFSNRKKRSDHFGQRLSANCCDLRDSTSALAPGIVQPRMTALTHRFALSCDFIISTSHEPITSSSAPSFHPSALPIVWA